MSQTNRIPRGLLDLLGAETGGKAPPLYGDTLSINVDASELYLGDTLASISGQLAVVSEGQTIDFNVPPNEYWLLRGCSVAYTNVAATDALRVNLRIEQIPRGTSPAGGAPSIWTSRLLIDQGPAFGNILTDSKLFPRPIMAASGCILSFSAEERVGNFTITTHILYNKLRAGAR